MIEATHEKAAIFKNTVNPSLLCFLIISLSLCSDIKKLCAPDQINISGRQNLAR